jgi:hypothetical protein
MLRPRLSRSFSFAVVRRALVSAARIAASPLATALLAGCSDGPVLPATTSGAGGGTTSSSSSSNTVVCDRPTTWTAPPACGSGKGTFQSLIDGPGASGLDALAAKAERIDRQFHLLNGFSTGLNTDVVVPVDQADARKKIEEFLKDTDGWDFAAYAKAPVTSVIGAWQQSAGGYSGPGVAADAFRYGTLRDQGADCAAVELAKQHLLADLDMLHLVTAITGVPGVIARGVARTDLPGDGMSMTTPLFDDSGKPLPEKKNNGTWRADNSGGQFKNYIWIDSCSRDMLVGWAVGYAAMWEVIRLDPAFPEDKKARLQADAEAVVRSLMKVGDKGYDLEIHDADGRLTYFGYLNENAIDTGYLMGAQNGFLALMAVGIVGAFGYVAEKPDLDEYLYAKLIGERHLDQLGRDNMIGLSLGTKSNYSDYNMAFDAGWLAYRYLCDGAARDVVKTAVETSIYARPGQERQPQEQGQSFYDFVYAATNAGATAGGKLGQVDEEAVKRGVETLKGFPDAPFWETARNNCDDAEIKSGLCVAEDGTTLHLLGYVGRGDTLVSKEPVPMKTRPASNYFWRTDPYLVNGDADGSRLLPAGDFRMAYWMGRWLRR